MTSNPSNIDYLMEVILEMEQMQLSPVELESEIVYKVEEALDTAI